MSISKVFSVSLDMKQPTAQRNEWEVVEGDNGNVIEITLTDDGLPVDLSSCKVLAVFGLPTGQTVEQDTDEGSVTIGGANHNVITIALKTGSFSPGKSSSGLMKCEIQVYSGVPQTTLVTSAQFTFRCRRAIMNDETIAATDEYPVLVELIEEVQQLQIINQSDWNEADPTDPSYIQNKPASMNPAVHHATHEAGGSDEITLPTSSTSASGIVQLYDGVDSSSTSLAATPNAVKTAYDLAKDAIPKSEKDAASGVAKLNSNKKVLPAETCSVVIELTNDTTLILSYQGCMLKANSDSDITITIPLNSTVGYSAGTEIEVLRYGTGGVTFVASTGVTLCSIDNKVSIADQYGCVCLKKISTNVWLLAGDLG